MPRPLKPKAMIQIGGSVLQQQTVSWAKAAGMAVLLTDSSDNPPLKASAAAFAQIDGTDTESLWRQAEEWAQSFDIAGVHCGGDFGLPGAALVAERLGLAHAKPDAVNRALDKAAALVCFRAAGVRTPEPLGPNPSVGDFPLIVKPADSSGSRGVSYVADPAEFPQALATAKAVSDQILVERHVDGQHIDVNGILWQGRFYPGELIERFFSPYPARFGTRMVTPPASLSTAQKSAIWATFEKAVRAVGIDHGPVKADLIVQDTDVCVLEVAPRLHGETNTFALPLAYGTCSAEIYLRAMANNAAPDTAALNQAGKVAGWIGIFPATTGIFKDLTGQEDAAALPGIDRIIIRRPIGSRIRSVRDNTAVIGFIYGMADTHDQLASCLNRALSHLIIGMD